MTNQSQFHAYTDGTDTIIGTSLDEAIAAYSTQNPDASGTHRFWEELSDSRLKTITMVDETGMPKATKSIREWIDAQIAESPDNFSRLLCSTEY
jgi:hypothetical protein